MTISNVFDNKIMFKSPIQKESSLTFDLRINLINSINEINRNRRFDI